MASKGFFTIAYVCTYTISLTKSKACYNDLYDNFGRSSIALQQRIKDIVD